jgi:prepilin-type processing-associated H-X9-DG protein
MAGTIVFVAATHRPISGIAMNHSLPILLALLAAALLGPAALIETVGPHKGRPVANVAFADDAVHRDAFANKTDEEGDDARRYYPLQLGNTWYYKIGESKFEMKVTKFEKVDGQNCARIEMSVGGKVQAAEFIAVRQGGVYRYGFQDQRAEPPVKFLELSGLPGHTWEVKSAVGAEKLAGTFKNGIVEKMTVPAGTFRNVVTSSADDLDASGTKISFTYYFAKDVGMIKQTIKINGQDVTMELEKFEAGGAKTKGDRKEPD